VSDRKDGPDLERAEAAARTRMEMLRRLGESLRALRHSPGSARVIRVNGQKLLIRPDDDHARMN
jgi:hypothetical protein